MRGRAAGASSAAALDTVPVSPPNQCMCGYRTHRRALQVVFPPATSAGAIMATTLRQRKKGSVVSEQPVEGTRPASDADDSPEPSPRGRQEAPADENEDGAYGYAPSDVEDEDDGQSAQDDGASEGEGADGVDQGRESQPGPAVLRGIDDLILDADASDDWPLFISAVLGFLSFGATGGVLPLYGVAEVCTLCVIQTATLAGSAD